MLMDVVQFRCDVLFIFTYIYIYTRIYIYIRCNEKADAVVNHMTGGGNDANPKHRISQGGTNCNTWGAKGTSAGNTSSPYYTQDYAYTLGEKTGLPPSQEFPAAMYWTRLSFSLLIVVFLFFLDTRRHRLEHTVSAALQFRC